MPPSSEYSNSPAHSCILTQCISLCESNPAHPLHPPVNPPPGHFPARRLFPPGCLYANPRRRRRPHPRRRPIRPAGNPDPRPTGRRRPATPPGIPSRPLPSRRRRTMGSAIPRKSSPNPDPHPAASHRSNRRIHNRRPPPGLADRPHRPPLTPRLGRPDLPPPSNPQLRSRLRRRSSPRPPRNAARRPGGPLGHRPPPQHLRLHGFNANPDLSILPLHPANRPRRAYSEWTPPWRNPPAAWA